MFFKKSFIALIFLTACVSNTPAIKKSQLSEYQIQKLEQAFQLMKEEQFLQAATIYDSLALSLKNSPTQVLSLYNSGLAYKSSGECKKALARFRSVLQKSLRKFKNFKSRSLLEISFIYECLGQEDMALSSLIDLEKLLTTLPLDFQEIVYPGRLSLAWVKAGDVAKANTYKSLSLKKILDYKQTFKNETEMNEQLSRLFYLMGKSYVKKEYIKADTFISAFFYHQLFLLQSLFLKDKTWSPQAQKQLNVLFDQLIYVLSQSKNRQKYKKSIEISLKAGSDLIKQEKSKSWNSFYKKRSKKVFELLSQS